MATIDTIADRSTGTATAGKMYFETSTNKLIAYNGYGWIELDSDGTGAAPSTNIATNTEANILASTPTNPSGEVNIAFATDTHDFYIYNGSAWFVYHNDS